MAVRPCQTACVIGQILFVLNALLIIIFVFVETRRANFKLINGVINLTKLFFLFGVSNHPYPSSFEIWQLLHTV